ncbi:MAG: efflux RND transporter permease subunit [Cyclobacteriaceae bacterium]
MSFRYLIEYFVKYPIVANIVIAITLIGGVTSILTTNKSFFPLRSDKTVMVSVAYPGASPEEMEEGVTLKIEEAVKSIPGIDEMFSTSAENSASITVITLDNYDIDEIYTEIKNAVDGVNSFPAGAEKPIIYKQRQRSTAQWLGLTGDVDLKTLKMFAEEIEDDLLKLPAVSQVQVSGWPPLEISIEVTEQNLRRYGMSFDQVASAVRFNNRDMSSGSIRSSSEEILIRSKAKQTDAAAIGEIVLRSNPDGSKVLLRDVAEIKEQFADQPNKSFLNGEMAAFIEVRKLENEDLQSISEEVTAYVDEFNERNEAVELVVAWNFMSMLQQRLDLLTSNGVVGLLLVLVALGTFLSLRLSFWVAWGIPASFLGMFILGSFVGLTINMISLFGMILVIGILVDDGIVIAENIYSHFEKSKNPVSAAINGTMEVLPAVTTSVTTTIVAFAPLLLLTGGFEFLKDMAIVVIFSLAFSLLEAFLVLPAHLASKKVLSVKKEDTRSYAIRSKINGFINWMKNDIYGSMLQFTMKYKPISYAATLAFVILVIGLLMGGQIRSTFFPNIPFNSFNVNISFKPGEHESKVESYLVKFERAIFDVNSELMEEFGTEDDIISEMITNVGYSQDGENGSHAGSINVFYEELDKYGINQYDLISKIREKIGPVPEAEKYSIGGGNRFGKPVSIRLLGKNYEELEQATAYLKTELSGYSELKEIQDNQAIGRREMLFDLRNEAYFMGLNHNEISRQVRQGYFGEEVQRFMKGNDELRVWVRYPREGRASIGQLEDVKIKTTTGGEYPLTQIADYRVERGLSGIRHYDASRAVTVEAEMIDPMGDVPPILQSIEANVIPELKANFPSVKIDFGGQSQESQRAMNEVMLYFGGAFVLIFFILMLTFRSVYQGLLIIGMIPLGWFSAMLGHGVESWISGREFPVSLLSMWGMVALSGVIINDAVVFLAKYNSLIKNEGQTVYQAAYNAGLSRFRPIVLTSLTTVLGLYPLIKETSFQAQFLIPMAISVAYGVLIGTFIILLFFPVFILIMNDIRRYTKWLWTGEKPTAEEVERVILDQKRLEEYRESA